MILGGSTSIFHFQRQNKVDIRDVQIVWCGRCTFKLGESMTRFPRYGGFLTCHMWKFLGFLKHNWLDNGPFEDVVAMFFEVKTLIPLAIWVCRRDYTSMTSMCFAALPHFLCTLPNAILSDNEIMVCWGIHVCFARNPYQRDCYMRMCLG